MRRYSRHILYSLVALSLLALPSYSGKSHLPTPVKLECKETTLDGAKVKFVTRDCANNKFYADGPKCNEVDGECPREAYRMEIERYGNITILLDVNGDLIMDSALVLEKSGRRYWIENKSYLEKDFRNYAVALFGASIFSNR